MIRIKGIKIPVEKNTKEELKNQISKKIKCRKEDIKEINIKKESIDARKKPNIFYVLEVDVNIENENRILKRNKNNKEIQKSPNEEYIYPKIGDKKLKYRPVIIGSGPAGLFCAYILSEKGYKPIIIERGEKVEDRIKTVEAFWKGEILNPNSNVQFGEGGAGTFSDGKLNTLTKDSEHRHKKVLEIFTQNGAPKEILYLHNPHIGTDILRQVIVNIRNNIIKKGGTFKYKSTMTDIGVKDNKIESILINNNETIETDILVLAIGHSARDTFEMLLKNGINIVPKPFAIGLRIEHPQELINKNQYGELSKLLPPASYKLTYLTKEKRGVYSFCMCPGGFVVNASSEKGRITTNGMSNNKRDTKNANSAIVVTVGPADYGNNPLDGIKYQRELEEKFFNLEGGKVPIQLLKDFKTNTRTQKLGTITPIIKGKYQFSNLTKALPAYITNSIKEALPEFSKKIKCFDMDDAILSGIEARTSSPVRIPRDEKYESNIKGIYPCGEGAGYSGGIITSSVDGIKIAEQIINLYSAFPNKNQ